LLGSAPLSMVEGSIESLAFPRFGRNVSGRDFAVGDVHGCFSALQLGLDSIGFDASVDRLFSVGDLVDRGPESHLVLQWLALPWFHAICGNHDFMIWRSALGNPYQDVDHRAHGGTWLDELEPLTRAEIGEALAALPLAMEIETSGGLVGLVHADCPFDDWRGMQAVLWHTVDPADALGECCLWSIERYSRHYSKPVRNVRAVVHGHMVVRHPVVLGNVHFIDTGGWKPGGYFTFLELETMKPLLGPKAASASPNLRNR